MTSAGGTFIRILVLASALSPLTATAQGSELRGRVVTTDSLPIPAATISVPAVGFSVRTDSLGWFRLTGTPGSTLSLSIAGAGFRAREVQVVLARGKVVVTDFVLERSDAPPAEGNPSALVLMGRVTDPEGEPLAYANLQLFGGRTRVTDDSGRFSIPITQDGIRLVVRRIGFEPVELNLEAFPDTAVRVVMQPVATLLPEMRVVGRSPFRSLELGGFYRRMRDVERGINRGWFITPEELEARKPFTVTSAIEHLPNIRIRRAPNPIGGRPSVEHLLFRVEDGKGCPLTVYVDRNRITPFIRGGVLVDDLINTMLIPTSLAGIEVYPRGLGAPWEFSLVEGTCGVVVLWSK